MKSGQSETLACDLELLVQQGRLWGAGTVSTAEARLTPWGDNLAQKDASDVWWGSVAVTHVSQHSVALGSEPRGNEG